MIRFAIVGTGRISDWILQGALQEKRFKAAGVCSRSAEKARDFISRHPEHFDQDALVFTDIEQVASCPEIDAVYIGTPNSTHLPYTLACLEAGKHVMCEKPLGLNESEVSKMIEAARRGGGVLMEAMISTLNPNFRAAAAKISEIGPVRHYSSGFCQYSSKYDALKQGIVANSFNPKMGGGALRDVGIYTTYPLICLFGYPDEIHSDMVNIPSGEGDVNIHGNVALRYDSGMTASLTFSKAVDAFAPTEICGEKGNILIDKVHIARQSVLRPHGAPNSGRGEDARPQIISEGLDYDEYYYEFKEFIDVIESGRRESDINSLQNSLLNVRLMDKILEGLGSF